MTSIAEKIPVETKTKLESLTSSNTDNKERWTAFYSLRRKMYWKSKQRSFDGTIIETTIKVKDMLDLHLKRIIKLIRERSKTTEDMWYTYPASQWIEVMSKELRYRSEMLKEVLSYFDKNKPSVSLIVSQLREALDAEMQEIKDNAILTSKEKTEQVVIPKEVIDIAVV